MYLDGTGMPQTSSTSTRGDSVVVLRKHDSVFSVSDDFQYDSTNDLKVLNGAALLCADCLGTGLLALPHDIKVLGTVLGLSFLVLNLPINLYAGTILSDAARYVEMKQARENQSIKYNSEDDIDTEKKKLLVSQQKRKLQQEQLQPQDYQAVSIDVPDDNSLVDNVTQQQQGREEVLHRTYQ